MKHSFAMGLATPRFNVEVRSVFISDLHLGSKCSQATVLNGLLERLVYERLYIVGDFFDGWLLPCKQSSSQLEQLHAIVRTIRTDIDRGVEVHYLLGNHDRALHAAMADWGLTSVGESRIHPCADGRRLLITHGDQFDLMQRQFPRTAKLAGRFHEALLCLSSNLAMCRSNSRRGFGTLATLPFKRLMQTYSRFDAGVRREIAKTGSDGIIFGHTHSPCLTEDGCGRLIANTGDWLENRTAIVESHTGQLELWGGNADEWSRWSPRRMSLAPPLDGLRLDASQGADKVLHGLHPRVGIGLHGLHD